MSTKGTSILLSGSLPKFIESSRSDFINLAKSPLYRYLDQFVKEERYLDNQGIALDDSDGDKILVHIDELYVIPKLSKTRITAEHLAEADGNEVATKSLQLDNVADLILENPRTVLLGDPGVGKSTLMKWLVCSFCHWSDNYAKKRIGTLFPLLLTVRKLSHEKLHEISNEEFINLIFKLQGASLSTLILEDEKAKNCFVSLLSNGQVFFLIDGLDEISQEVTHWLAKQVKKFLSDYPKTRLLMTSRIVGFNNYKFWYDNELLDKQNIDSIFLQENFQNYVTDTVNSLSISLLNDMDSEFEKSLNLPTVLYLSPFSPEQRKAFSENWVKKYLPPKAELRKGFTENITNISSQLMQINALSRIPVLLNLICFIQWRRGRLPHGRAELYQRIVGTYLESMDKSRRLEHQISHEYDYQDIKNWLSRLAYFMQSGDLCLPKNDIRVLNDDELEEIREILPNIRRSSSLFTIKESELKKFLEIQLSEIIDVNSLSEHSEHLVNYLQKRTGFLIPKGVEGAEDVFGFSHLSFQEYFCAYFISLNLDTLQSSDDVFKSLVETIFEPRWKEIWVLVFEELSTQGRSRKEIGIFYDRVFSSIKASSYGSLFISQVCLLQKEFLDNTAIKLPIKKEKSLEKDLLKTIYTNSLCTALASITSVDEDIENETFLLDLLKDEKALVIYKNRLRSYIWLKELTGVKKLSLKGFNNIDDFDEFKKISFQELEKLTLNGDFEALPNLNVYGKVKDISIESSYIKDLPNFKKFNNMECLKLYYITESDVLNKISSKSLTSLYLHNSNLDGVNFGCNTENLCDINIFFSIEINDFKFISETEKLTSLSILGSGINGFKGIDKCKQLIFLSISHCDIDSGVDWSLLGELSSLERLIISIDKSIDISFLKKLKKLKVLDCDLKSGISEKQEIILNYLKSKGVKVY